MRANQVELTSICHDFGAAKVLDNIALAIPRGTYTVLLGSSGSGKTTLLSILGGFLTPKAGEVRIDGEDVTSMAPARRPTATVFQDYALFPHMTVGDNVGFGLRMRGLAKPERRAKAADALAMVGLSEAIDRKPHQLSGGQRQRVALARAIVIEPKVLLLDEPLGALDLALRRQMQDELKRLQQRLGATFIHVTHDQEEAMAIADEIVLLNRGRIEDRGPPQRIYLEPKTRTTALFMGESNILEGRVTRAGDGFVEVETSLGRFEVAGNVSVGTSVALSLRPEHARLGGAPAGWQSVGNVRVLEAVFLGTRTRVRAETASGLALTAEAPQTASIAAGQEASLQIDPTRLVLLRD